MMTGRQKLAIVIVSWNVREMLLACLRSVFEDMALYGIEGTVWVVDNVSKDGTAQTVRETFPQVRLIEPAQNLGFAGGNNLALRAIGFPDGAELPDAVLLLNPDTLVRPGALRALLDALMLPGVGLAGARLVYGDGTFQHSAFGFPGLLQLIFDLFPVPGRLIESRLNGRYPRVLYRRGTPFRVDHPLGATFMLRREVIAQTGMFDENFFMYCEEIDWAIRIREAGWKAVCVPSAEVVHYGGQSTGQVKPRSVVNLWAARIRLYAKHYGPARNLAARNIIRMGMKRLIRRTEQDTILDRESRSSLIEAYRQVIVLTHRAHI